LQANVVRRMVGSAVLVGLVFGSWSVAQASTDRQFDLFWAKFKAALRKDDAAAIANMTKLPYILESKQLNRQQFVQSYSKIFPSSVKKCLLKETAQKDKDSYMFFCGEQIFVFSKTKGQYLFVEIGAND
jgi:hypothetical protein